MSFDEFLSRGADFMTTDRPDIWKTKDEALRTLTDWAKIIRNSGQDEYAISSGGFVLSYQRGNVVEETEEEWNLTRQVLTYSPDLLLEPGLDPIFDWTEHTPSSLNPANRIF